MLQNLPTHVLRYSPILQPSTYNAQQPTYYARIRESLIISHTTSKRHPFHKGGRPFEVCSYTMCSTKDGEHEYVISTNHVCETPFNIKKSHNQQEAHARKAADPLDSLYHTVRSAKAQPTSTRSS